jgi:hypothetical protein
MQRFELEHVIRACGEIADDDEFIIIGSQAILGQFPNAPLNLLMSMETDIYPKNMPDQADKIDGNIGEGSRFHATHGYYAQGVGPGTAVLPQGWQDRLLPVKNENTNGNTGLCLEVHDLAISKLVASRSKDTEFVSALVYHEMISHGIMLQRLSATELTNSEHSRIKFRIDSIFDR